MGGITLDLPLGCLLGDKKGKTGTENYDLSHIHIKTNCINDTRLAYCNDRRFCTK